MIITEDLVSKIDEVLGRGLCRGVGDRDGQMCVEAAICYALGEPHGDQPSCVSPAVRAFKIVLNDATSWGSEEARAQGMRALAIAQLGSRDVVDDVTFSKKVALRTVREILPPLLRSVGLMEQAQDCASVTTLPDARRTVATVAAATAAYATAAYATATAAADATAYAANAAALHAHAVDATTTADATATAYAANYAAYAAYAANAAGHAAATAARAAARAAPYRQGIQTSFPTPIQYLQRSALIALETLDQLGSPGCKWLREHGQWPEAAR